jgi:hypothetical protein
MLLDLSDIVRSYKMDKIIFQDFQMADGSLETYAIIDRGNGEFTSMPKSHYEAQQAEQSTPSVTGDE